MTLRSPGTLRELRILPPLLATVVSVVLVGALGGSSLQTAAALAGGPSLSVDPGSGKPGAQIQVSGTRFPEHSYAKLTWSGSSASDSSTTIHVEHGHDFSRKITIPKLSPGSYILTARDGSATATASVTVLDPSPTSAATVVVPAATVTAPKVATASVKTPAPTGATQAPTKKATSTPAASDPPATSAPSVSRSTATRSTATLAVSPGSGLPGTQIQVAGSGFKQGSHVTVAWNGASGSASSFTFHLEHSTSFNQTTSIPQVPAGSYTVTASDGSVTASASATVLGQQPTQVLSDPTVTSTATATTTATATATTTATASPTVTATASTTATVTPTSSPTVTATATTPPTAGACSFTLQSLVDAAAAGSTVEVPACIFRETVTINKPLTLDGQGAAQIRGSDVWTGWSQNGSVWVSSQTVPSFSEQNANYCQTASCAWPEQVFYDGTALSEVSPGSTPGAGQFALNGSRQVVLGSDPSGHTVEVTMRTAWTNVESDGVTIENFTMRDAANSSGVSATGNQSTSNFALKNNVLSDAHGAVVGVGGGTNVNVIGNDISRGGDLGIDSGPNDHVTIQNNKIHDNNIAGFNWEWQAGGAKLWQSTNLVVDGNEFWNNNGPGFWCDGNCNGVTISNNKVHDNQDNPIFFEIGSNATIYNNSIWNSNGWGSIVVSSSGDTQVYGNTVDTSPSIEVLVEQRSDAPSDSGVNDQVYNNNVVAPTDGQATNWSGASAGSNGDTDVNNNVLTGQAATDALTAAGIPSS